MAQPNVAREPSMDEILASIRKIIENNEAMPDLAADAEDDGGFDITTGSEDRALLDHPVVVEQFHAEERHAAAVQPLPRAELMQGAVVPEEATLVLEGHLDRALAEMDHDIIAARTSGD